LVARAIALTARAVILRSFRRKRVSKDVSGGSGDIWTVLRDAASRLLRMRAACDIGSLSAGANDATECLRRAASERSLNSGHITEK
jgi:hypothetical protein